MNHASYPASPPGPDRAAAAGLVPELNDLLRRLQQERHERPYLNPVLLLAHHISQRLADGSLDAATLGDAIQSLSSDGFLWQ